ncbi:hypothetical protein TRAPUB_2892 [Trametes pubescens]|uniref:Uncharacterized protein n=1 Tax=Trametes pubescens TaxID=154538 RepID=A0A1M2VF79_TRAPU|nr:hypothetical protein TRAPUB_2892 [Trametes pubescens]
MLEERERECSGSGRRAGKRKRIPQTGYFPGSEDRSGEPGEARAGMGVSPFAGGVLRGLWGLCD